MHGAEALANHTHKFASISSMEGYVERTTILGGIEIDKLFHVRYAQDLKPQIRTLFSIYYKSVNQLASVFQTLSNFHLKHSRLLYSLISFSICSLMGFWLFGLGFLI